MTHSDAPEASLTTLTWCMALAILPLVVLLTPNPVADPWTFRHGGLPMPPEVAERAERAGRYMMFVRDGLVLLLVLLLMFRHVVGARLVGFHSQHPKLDLFIGCVAGLGWIGLQSALRHLFPGAARAALATAYMQKGSLVFWVVLLPVGAFAEEFWRAFCLVALRATGHSISFAVVLTALAFGAAHFGYRFGASAEVIFGVVAALLFLRLGSFLPMYLFHLFSSLGGLYLIRRVAPIKSSGCG